MSGKIFLLLFLSISFLFSKVSVEVDKKNVIKGDSLTIIVKVEGQNITFPDIYQIGDYKIQSKSTSQKFQQINGLITREKSIFYTITPLDSFTIPELEVKVDGKIEKTKPLKINVIEDKNLKNNFVLEINTPDKIYQNYSNLVTIRFLQKTSQDVAALSIDMPKGNFSLNPIGKEKQYFEGIYKVYELTYEFIPKNSGEVDLTTSIKIGKEEILDNYGFIHKTIKYKTITTPKKVKILPMPINIIGDYKISLSVDKTSANSNTPINATLNIEGEGDLSALEDIKINVPNLTIYDEKPVINKTIKDNKIYSNYTKKYVILANSDYTIPKMNFSFYSIKDNKLKTIFTKEINVKIIAPQKEIIKEVVKKEIEYKNNYFIMVIIFVAGIVIGFILGLFIKRVKKEKFNMPQDLYKKLLPFADDKEVLKLLYKLENKEKLSREEKEYIKTILS
jgi:hypothetical protein